MSKRADCVPMAKAGESSKGAQNRRDGVGWGWKRKPKPFTIWRKIRSLRPRSNGLQTTHGPTWCSRSDSPNFLVERIRPERWTRGCFTRETPPRAGWPPGGKAGKGGKSAVRWPQEEPLHETQSQAGLSQFFSVGGRRESWGEGSQNRGHLLHVL